MLMLKKWEFLTVDPYEVEVGSIITIFQEKCQLMDNYKGQTVLDVVA